MSLLAASIAAAQLFALSGGQVEAAPPPPPVEAARPAGDAPSKLSDDDGEGEEGPAVPAASGAEPLVAVPPPPPLLQLPAPPPPGPAKPPPPDRIRTSEGKVHVGRILRAIDGGLEFQNEAGERYPLALSAVVAVERGEQAWRLPAAEPPDPVDPEGVRRELALAFDIAELERERAALTYGEKALLCGLGVGAIVLGFAGIKGEPGMAVGIAGAVGAGGGAVALAVTGIRSHRLSRRIEEARAQLEGLGGPAGQRQQQAPSARGTVVRLPALAVRF